MLKAMRAKVKKSDWDGAASIAKDAAPYMHPKLASVQHAGPGGGPIQTVDLSNLTETELSTLERIFGPIAGGTVEGDGGDQGGEGA